MKQKRGALNAKQQFNEASSYLRKSKNYIYVSIGLFIFSAVMGFIFKENLSVLNELIRKMILESKGLNTWEMIMFILQNNFQVSVIVVISGALIGLIPIFIALSNGLVVGYVLALTSDAAGFASWWRLLPHGVFELPAIFIALGLGIKLGFAFFTQKNQLQEFKHRFYNSCNVLLMVVFPLLVIAAIIEGILIALL